MVAAVGADQHLAALGRWELCERSVEDADEVRAVPRPSIPGPQDEREGLARAVSPWSTTRKSARIRTHVCG
jgi:hypothetical protein